MRRYQTTRPVNTDRVDLLQADASLLCSPASVAGGVNSSKSSGNFLSFFTTPPKIGLWQGTLQKMWTYLQRWQVANCLYHLLRKRDNAIIVAEHDLFAWIGGQNIMTHTGRDTLLDRMRFRLNGWFFGATTYQDMFTKLGRLVSECQDTEVNWIRRVPSATGISPSLVLTTRGREIYPYSHLVGQFFGNWYVKWAFPFVLAWMAGHWFNLLNVTVQTTP